MERKKILINDNMPRDVADLRKVLAAAGYDVRIVRDCSESLEILDSYRPNLIISEVRMPVMDGPHFLQEVRSRPSTQTVPFIMTGRLQTVEARVNVMKLPVDDYLQKPFDVDEALVRVDNLIREVELHSSSPRPRWRGFSGNLAEMNLVDLLKTIEVGKKSCIIKLRQYDKEGTVYVTEGQVIDAELGNLEAKAALLRMFTWADGTFQVELRYHDRPRMLTIPNRDLISEGLTRQHRWEQLKSQLPPLHSVVMPVPGAKSARLGGEEQGLLRLIASHPTKRIIDIVEQCPADDLRALTVMKKIHDQGAITALEMPATDKTSDHLERLKAIQASREDGTLNPGALLKQLLRPPDDQPDRQHGRRRIERRHLPDRRQSDRRRRSGENLRNRVYLNRSELIMIREKLARFDSRRQMRSLSTRS